MPKLINDTKTELDWTLLREENNNGSKLLVWGSEHTVCSYKMELYTSATTGDKQITLSASSCIESYNVGQMLSINVRSKDTMIHPLILDDRLIKFADAMADTNLVSCTCSV